MSARTPGKWVVDGSSIVAPDHGGARVATAHLSRADADLIASAPELLEMLADLLYGNQDDDADRDRMVTRLRGMGLWP